MHMQFYDFNFKQLTYPDVVPDDMIEFTAPLNLLIPCKQYLIFRPAVLIRTFVIINFTVHRQVDNGSLKVWSPTTAPPK